MTGRRSRSWVLAALAVVPLACGDGGSTKASEATGVGDAAALDVVASFYPLAYALVRVGGERVAVTNLTPAGVEPHDLELTPDDVRRLGDADLVVHLAGFSPAVDDAASAETGDRAFDVAPLADLDLTYVPIEEGEPEPGEQGVDPHFWLDPSRLAGVADGVADRLAELDPDGAATFRANAATLRADLDALDAELRDGLASCAGSALVTSHNAFGYLAARYGLVQRGITGLTPENEPSPAALADATRFVEDNDVRTIYYEALVDPAVAETVAAETGAATAVLDPLEGLSDESAGADYLQVMRANLAALRAGQPCP